MVKRMTGLKGIRERAEAAAQKVTDAAGSLSRSVTIALALATAALVVALGAVVLAIRRHA